MNNSKLIKQLTLHEFKKQYFGTYFGLFWAFAQPIMFILVIWFVFDIGLRSNSVNGDTPFFLWLICGMIPWFFFSNAFSASSYSLINNSYLIKKVAFRVSILPIIQINAALIIHFFLVLLLLVAFLIYGYTPNIYWFQIIYYIFSLYFLLFGLSLLTSALRVFIVDLSSFINILLQLGFWGTPIFWSIDLIPQQYQYLIKFNPLFYIVEGFRDSLINGIWFFEKINDTLYFLCFSIILLIIGSLVFRKLRPHFGDVL